jgi:hypothetical protein
MCFNEIHMFVYGKLEEQNIYITFGPEISESR